MRLGVRVATGISITFMSKILMPVDGSAHSVHVAQFVARLAPVMGLEVHVLTACEPIDYRSRAFMSAEEVEREYADQTEAATRPSCAILDAAGVQYNVHSKPGDPADVILAECERLACDHIVMGSRGARAIAAALLGSVAYKVMHEATVPVTIVR